MADRPAVGPEVQSEIPQENPLQLLSFSANSEQDYQSYKDSLKAAPPTEGTEKGVKEMLGLGKSGPAEFGINQEATDIDKSFPIAAVMSAKPDAATLAAKDAKFFGRFH